MARIDLAASRQECDSIGTILTDAGYFDYELQYSGDTIVITSGIRFQLGNVDLAIIDAEGKVRSEIVSGYRGLEASRVKLEGVKDDILLPYQDKGHYFASLNTDQIKIDDGMIEPHYKLIAGPQVTIERVRFKGLKKSKPDFVRKLSGLREGDLFVSATYREAIRRIEAGDYFENDSLPQMTPNENYDGVELLFYLTELKSNRLELGGGYLPGRGTEKGEFVGRLRFESKNLFGSGRRIDMIFDRKDRASSRVEFRFVQPFFVPDHLELDLHFQQVDYDSTYHLFAFEGSVALMTRGHTRVGTGVSWTKTEPQRSSQPPSRILSGSVHYELRSLDSAPNPSSGNRLKAVFSYLRRTSWPDSVASAVINNESMFELASDQYWPIGRGIIFRVNLESRVRITSRELIDYSEQFKLGGYGSLRGYRQDQFAGRRIFMGQSELRYRPSRNSAIYLFTDAGYIYSRKEVAPGKIRAEELTRIGSGLGLYLGSPTARVTLEIGWGHLDRIDEGKVHFGLITMF